MACNGLKQGSFHLFVHPKRSRIISWKNKILTHFWSKTAHFQSIYGFGGAKIAQHGLKMGPFHLFRHPKWSWIIVGKTHF